MDDPYEIAAQEAVSKQPQDAFDLAAHEALASSSLPSAQSQNQPQPGLQASATKNVKAKAQTPDWQNFVQGLPVVGDLARGAGQVINNAGQAAQELGKDPASSIMAGLGGAFSGGVGALEAPAALGGRAITNLLIPQGMRTQRQFPQQVAGTPEEQAAKVLQQKQATDPAQYGYQRAVGGIPFADRIAQATQKQFPNEPGSIATGQVVGGLAAPVKGLNIVNRTVNNPIARGAIEGAGIGEMYHLGEQAAHDQALQPSVTPAIGGALIGGALNTPAGKGAIKTAEKVAGLPGKALGTITGTGKKKVSEIKPIKPATQEATVEKKVVGQIVKPKAEFANPQQAMDAVYGKNPEKAQAALDYLKKTQGGKAYEEPVRAVEEPATAKESSEEQTAPQVKEFYDQWGKEPLAKAPEETKPTHEERSRVAANEVFEADPEAKSGGPKYTKPFDTTNPEQRPAKWRGILYGAEPHGQEGHVTLTAQIGKKGFPAIKARMEEGRTQAQMFRDAEKGLTPEQSYANERIQEEGLQGNTPQTQIDTAQKTARIEQAVNLIQNNDLEGLKKLNEPSKKLSDVKKPTILKAEVIPGLTAITDMAEQAHETPSWAAQKLLGNDWVQTLKPLFDVRDTLDRIKDSAARNESNFYNELMTSHTNQALDTMGEDITEGQKGLEVRNAVRKLKIDDILDREKTPDWTPETRNAAAKMKHYYDEQQSMIKNEIKRHANDKEYSNVLKEYSGQLSSYRNEIDDAVGKLNHKLYESALAKNLAYHGLVSLHPWQAGSTVAGIENVALADSLILADPKIKSWLDQSARNITGDYRSGFREEMYAKEGKEAPKDIPTSRWNNSRILLAGMLKKGGVEGVHDLIDNFNEGKPLTEANSEVMLSGLEALRDATGNILGGGNRTFTTRHPIYKFLAQMSGYRGTIDRLLVNSVKGLASKDPEAKAEAGRRIATLLAATTLMGGSAPIPEELRDALWKLNPRGLYALEHMLNQLNVARRVPIVGRDLSKHTRFSFLNWGKSLGLEAGSHLQKTIDKQWKETEDLPLGTRTALLVGRVLWETPWSMWGFGSSVIRKNATNFRAATSPEHEKPVYAFNQGHLLKSGVRKNYGIFDALADNLPGDNPEVGNWEYKQYVKHMDSLRNEPIPENLESDYPSPNIEDR